MRKLQEGSDVNDCVKSRSYCHIAGRYCFVLFFKSFKTLKVSRNLICVDSAKLWVANTKKSQENVMQEDFQQQVTLIITNKCVCVVYNVSHNRIRPRLKRQPQRTLRRLRQQLRLRHARRLKMCRICNVRHRYIQAMNGKKTKKNNLKRLQTKYPFAKNNADGHCKRPSIYCAICKTRDRRFKTF
jgi:hypothetical protein